MARIFHRINLYGDALINPSSKKIVEIRNVYKQFHIGDLVVSVLRGISLEIDTGEFVAIVGASGNGKSTLLNMITGIDHPSAGEVRVGGQLLSDLSENQLAVWRGENLGIVFQFFQLLPALNLLQNVILPMDFVKRLSPRDRRQRAEYLLDMVGLADQMFKLPSQVSGGQQQRAAIARALANDPPVLVADEPTGNLDTRTSNDVFNLFSHLNDQGKTLIMVTHNEELACQVPRTIEIKNGLLVRDENCNQSNPNQLIPEMESSALAD
jgi:putative ABC transport system ATP-binding protein